MQNDSILKFRLGVFVLGSLLLLATLIVLFGEVPDFFRSQLHYALKLPQAPGIVEGTPIRKSGIRIGEVTHVELNPDTGEVTIGFVVEKRYQLRTDDLVTLSRGLVLGESAINFAPKPEGKREPAPDGYVFAGRVPDDLGKAITDARDLVPLARESMEEVKNAAKRFNELAPELRKTNAELQVTLNNVSRAAESADNLLRTNQDRINTAIDNVAKTAAEFGNLLTPENQRKLTRLIDNAAAVSDRLPGFFNEENRANLQATLKNVNAATENLSALLSEDNRKAATKAINHVAEASERLTNVLSEQNQKNITESLANIRKSSDKFDELASNLNAAAADARTSMKSLDEVLKDGKAVVKKVGESANRFDEAMVNIRDVAKTLSERAPTILKNIEDTSSRFSAVATDVGEFTKALNSGDGTIRRLVADPSLYNNLNAGARSASASLGRFDKVMKDLEVFADKLARHPEMIGVRGAVSPSSGIK